MELILLAILCLPILWLAIVWITCLFQEINHSLRKAAQHMREIFWELKWAKVRFDIKRKWR